MKNLTIGVISGYEYSEAVHLTLHIPMSVVEFENTSTLYYELFKLGSAFRVRNDVKLVVSTTH